MRPTTCITVLIAFWATTPGAALASDEVAENHLVDAADAYGRRDWDAALAALAKARQEVHDPFLAARIERQAGLVSVALDQPAEALERFRQALRRDPALELDPRRFGPAIRSLFACAQKIPWGQPPVTELQADSERGWICPWPAGPGPSLAVQTPSDLAAPAAPDTRTSADDRPHADARTSAAPPPADTRTSADARPHTDPQTSAVNPPALAPAVLASTRRLGGLGGLGIGLMVVGLGGGGAIFGWQSVEANKQRNEAQTARDLIANIGAYTGDPGELVSRFNAAEASRVDHENAAVIAAATGGGLAALGLALLIVDLANAPDTEVTGLALQVGPSFASVSVQF